MRLIGAIAVGFGLLCAATTAAQRSPVPLTEAERAIRAEKGAFLLAALKRESPVEPERLGESIRVALVDTDWAIRELALATISGRVLVGSIEAKSESERERPELQRLRPLVVKALDDENDNVRRGAVGALQSLDFDGTQAYGRWLSAETTESLTRLYRREPSPSVRFFIVAVLGRSAKQNPAALSTLRAATRDEAPTVREMALRATSELEP
jgi:HEAT repeat protein